MKLNWLTKGSDDQNLGGKSESFGTWVQATSKPITWSFCPLNAYQTDSPIEYIGTFVETNNIRLLISYMQRIWMWYGCIIGPRIELQHRRDDFKSLDEAFWIDTWICLYDIKIKWIKIFKIEPRHRCYEMNLYPNMFFLFWTGLPSVLLDHLISVDGVICPVRSQWLQSIQVVASMVLSYWKRFLWEGDFKTLEGRGGNAGRVDDW